MNNEMSGQKGYLYLLMTDQLFKFPDLVLIFMDRCLLPKYLGTFPHEFLPLVVK